MKNVLLGLTITAILSLWSCDGAVSKYHLGAQFIALQPYEDINTDDLNIAKKAIEDYYGYDVKILDPIKLPEIAKRKLGKGYKYNADELLLHLKQALPNDVTKIVGMLEGDLYTKPKDGKSHRVVSKSERPGTASVMSTHLIKKSTTNPALFQDRFKKIVLKEIGHTIGLSNCPTKDKYEYCLMKNTNGSGRSLDYIGYHFCDKCAKKLNWNDKAYNK